MVKPKVDHRPNYKHLSNKISCLVHDESMIERYKMMVTWFTDDNGMEC